MPTHQLMPKGAAPQDPPEICLFAQTNYRGQMRRFGIKTDDRRRHMYVVGKTGMGKTTMMENMVLNDIYRGHGVGIVDPHGDFAEKIINFIPANRINDVVYFNPADTDYPIGFNILEVKSEEQQHLIAAGLMGTFKKIWPDVWSSRMEYILNNTILALLDYPGSTLLGINRMLGEKDYRKKVVRQLHDPVVKSFWQNEFENYEPRYQKEAVAPIQNKIGQFLSASVIRNMVAQVKSTINVRELMDSRKIFIMNLSKGRIGEDNSRLLGGMLITKLQLSAMERVDTLEADRKDFFLYVDEFQNFATPSFANILSEARKYRLSLIMAHQYVKQLDEIVADAVFGNVGTIVSFRVGGGDAEVLAKEYAPIFLEENIVNLSKFSVIMKLMIDGVASQPFTAQTMPPIGSPTGSADKVIRVSRERYGRNKGVIEEKILRWSGLGELKNDDDYDEEAELKKAADADTRYDDYDGDEGVIYKDEVYEKEKTAGAPKSEPKEEAVEKREDTPREEEKRQDRPERNEKRNDERRDDRRDERRDDRRDDRKKNNNDKPKDQTVSLKQLLSEQDKASLSELAREVVEKQVTSSTDAPVAPVVLATKTEQTESVVAFVPQPLAQQVQQPVSALEVPPSERRERDREPRRDDRRDDRQDRNQPRRDGEQRQRQGDRQSQNQPQDSEQESGERRKRKRRRKKKSGDREDGGQSNQQQSQRRDERPRDDRSRDDRPRDERPRNQEPQRPEQTLSRAEAPKNEEVFQSQPPAQQAQSINEDEIITFD